jgi:hypothetical protein
MPGRATGVLFDLPGVTQRQYESLMEALWLEQERPVGALLHLAGPHPAGGWLVVDVWESEAAFERFARAKLIPAAKAVGIAPVKPRLFPVHDLMTAERDVLGGQSVPKEPARGARSG